MASSKGSPSRVSESVDVLKLESVKSVLEGVRRITKRNQSPFPEDRADVDRRNLTVSFACQELIGVLSPEALKLGLTSQQAHVVRSAVIAAFRDVGQLSTGEAVYHTDCNKVLGIATYLETLVLRGAQEQEKATLSERITEQSGSVAASIRKAAQ